MLFLKTFKDAKFVVDGNAFQTFTTLSTKNFCLMLAMHYPYAHTNSQRQWSGCSKVRVETVGKLLVLAKKVMNSVVSVRPFVRLFLL